MKAIIFESLLEFRRLHDRVHKAMLKMGARQDRWCFPVEHPTDHRIRFVVEDRILQYLTDEEQKQIVELDASWFPKSEEDITAKEITK